MSTHGSPTPDFDPADPELTRFDLVREGARRDGVEIVHYRPKFPVPGTKQEKRVERTIAFLFTLTGLGALGFVVAYIWWPFAYTPGSNLAKLYTPVLGFCMGVMLLSIGLGIITWAKKLLPDEISVQDRHDQDPDETERALTGATMLNMVDELGIKRRPLPRRAGPPGGGPGGVGAGGPPP